MPIDVWTKEWYKEYLKKEISTVPKKDYKQVSIILDCKTMKFNVSQVKNSFVENYITMADLQYFVDELERLKSSDIAALTDKTRKIRCWWFYGPWFVSIPLIIILFTTVQISVWWVLFIAILIPTICFALCPCGLCHADQAQVDCQKIRRVQFHAAFINFRNNPLVRNKLEIENSPNYAWFSIISTLKKYLIPTGSVFTSEMWGTCKISYIPDCLQIICQGDAAKSIRITEMEKFFKFNTEVPAFFSDGSGFAFEMSAIMLNLGTINIYKADNSMVFRSLIGQGQIVIDDGELYNNAKLGQFRVSYHENNTIFRQTSVQNENFTIQTTEWKLLLTLNSEVNCKWIDAAGFKFEVKGSMINANSIVFLQNNNQIILERTTNRTPMPNDNNLTNHVQYEMNPSNQKNTVMPLPSPLNNEVTQYSVPQKTNEIKLKDEELDKDVDNEYLGTDYSPKPMIPFEEMAIDNYPDEPGFGVEGNMNYPSEFVKKGSRDSW